MIDRFTRWPEVIPLSDTSALSCARALITHWITRFGLPDNLFSDRGPQFTSELWSSVANLLGIKLHFTTAYHPQANGLLERFHRHMKEALRARLTDANWVDALPWVLLGIRTAPKEDLNSSSAELVYGFPITVPGDCLPTQSAHTSVSLPQLRANVGSLQPYLLPSTDIPNRLYFLSCTIARLCLFVVMPTVHRYNDHMKDHSGWSNMELRRLF